MALQNQNYNFPSYGETLEKLSFTSLELDALNSLEESIRCHETNVDNNAQFNDRFEAKIEPVLVQNNMFTNSSKQSVNQSTRVNQPRKLNTGYILFDGSEIKYISTNETKARTISKPPQELCIDGTLQSRTSENSTHVSELASHLNLSSDVLIRDSFKDTTSRISLTPYKRLPTYVHFSTVEKFYLLAIGAVPVLTLNAFYVSMAFFLPVLEKQVLSEMGICHHIPFLSAVLLIFCGKKHWIPFFPTLIICFVLMCLCVTVIPSFVAAGATMSVFAIYGVITLNGLCAGVSQSLISRMVVLFPGGKSSMLIRYGESVGTLFPAALQIILILSTGLNSTESQLHEQNTLCFYVLFGAVFLATLLGLISLIKLSRSGIYELFAGRDCAAHSPKNITLGSVPETAKRRYHAIRWFLFSEFTLSLVSYFVLSLAPFIHDATFQSSRSSTVQFWKVYLATVLVAVFRVGDFLGRMLSRFCCGEKKLDINLAKFCYLTASVLRMGFVVVVVFFTRTPFLVYHNLFMIVIYFMLAFTNGSLSVAMASSCQSFIMVQRRDSCPIVFQFLCLSGILGATIGIALSFIQLTM